MNSLIPSPTPAESHNDSLPVEHRTLEVPNPQFGVPTPTTSPASAAETATVVPFPGTFGNESLQSLRTGVLTSARDAELPDLACSESILTTDETTAMPRFRPAPRSVSTVSSTLSFEVPPEKENWAAEVAAARRDTDEAIASYLDHARTMRGLTKARVDANGRMLRRLFSEPLIDDPILGLRPVLLPELLRPDYGTLIVGHLYKHLSELSDNLAINLLTTARPFFRWIVRYGAALPSGVNLRDRYGRLVCPIDDRDLPRPKKKSEVFLPRVEQMPDLFDEISAWASGRIRHRATAFRTAAITIFCFETGARGVEARNASFDDQLFVRDAGLAGLANPLNLIGAKGSGPRRATVNPFGWTFLLYWLEHWRPSFRCDFEGPLFPSRNGGATLSGASLSETSAGLLRHLKAKKLLHDSFTFHATRKTYATHYLERQGVSIDDLLAQCGWSSPMQLGTYVRPTAASIAAARSGFVQTLGVRRAA